jgi:four helix bundle protein
VSVLDQRVCHERQLRRLPVALSHEPRLWVGLGDMRLVATLLTAEIAPPIAIAVVVDLVLRTETLERLIARLATHDLDRSHLHGQVDLRAQLLTTATYMALDHTKLDVYHRALDLLDRVDAIYEAMPKGRAHLKDQLDRAATSVVLNVAEGAGEFSKDEKQRFYRIARRSATETGAILDILGRRGTVTADLLQPAHDLVVRVVSMLVRLAST